MKDSPYVLLSLTSLFWSFNFIIGKIVAGVIPPVTISFLRWLPPFVIFLLFAWKEVKEHWGAFVARWPLMLLLGATGYCFNSLAVYEAVRFTTTINTSLINAFNPVLIAVAGYIFYGERINRIQILGFTLSFAGVLCIIFQGHGDLLLSLKINVGDLFMVGSICIWSIHTLLYKNKAPGFPERPMFTLMMLAGLLVTLPMAFIENEIDHWSWINRLKTVHVAGILGLNIFPSLLAYQFWNRALKTIPANEVAIFLYLIPVYTTIVSILFLGEHLRTYHILGGLLIFVGVPLVTNSRLPGKNLKADASSRE
jgi:drug/metabolite transporter (DMT)-like permease